MDRRSFLKLPALLPLASLGAEHHFQYEGIIGTSLDLVVSAPQTRVAEGVCRTVLDEINRLAAILDTRDPHSEISLLTHTPSLDLAAVFDAYDYWERRTGGIFSIRSNGPDQPRNVDALGKAYILDSAVKAAWQAWPSVDSILLNIGGDIVVRGRSRRVAVADPLAPYDNAVPFTFVDLHNAAIATSGTYARGAHLKDPRTGQSKVVCSSSTIVARDAVTANALATTLCLTTPEHGRALVESTPHAKAIRVLAGRAPDVWPNGYKLTITLPLTSGRASKRPYVAVWVDDNSGNLVRVLALWGNKSKYYPDLSLVWDLWKTNQNRLHSVSRATRGAGKYELVWDGLDDYKKSVSPGMYRITVETNQERGTYAKQTGTIMLGDNPTSIMLPATANFDTVMVQYGPR